MLTGIVVSMVIDDLVAANLVAALVAGTAGLAIRRLSPQWVWYPSTVSSRRVASDHHETASWWQWVLAAFSFAFVLGQALGIFVYGFVGSQRFDDIAEVTSQTPLWLIAGFTLVAAPLGEEVIFRGLIYPMLRRDAMSPAVAIVVTSLVFALIHANIVQLAVTAPLALLLAVVYEHTRRVWPCVALHGGFNLLAMLVPVEWISAMAEPAALVVLLIAFLGAWGICFERVCDVQTPRGTRLG